MNTEQKQEGRGSARIFELTEHDHVAFAKALTKARHDYEVKWWWKYGQPVIDAIHATLEVKPAALGSVVAEVMELNTEGIQATLQAFPYGQPRPDVYRVDVKLSRRF